MNEPTKSDDAKLVTNKPDPKAEAAKRQRTHSVLAEAFDAIDANERTKWKARAGLFGPSGSGKTQGALSIPAEFNGEHKKRLLIDYDGRWQTAAGFPDTKIITIFDPDPTTPKAWNRAEILRKELWAAARKGRFPYSAVIEDGGTMMGRYAMNFALLMDPKRGLGGTPAKHHYGPQMKAFADHILSMKELPCHYIFCGHHELIENPDDESIIYLPKVIGKTARTEFAGWFDEIYWCQRQNTKSGLQYTWITQGAGKLDFFKSTLNQLGRFWKDPIVIDFNRSVTGFAQLLEYRFGKPQKHAEISDVVEEESDD